MEFSESPAEQLNEEELEAQRSLLRTRSVRGVAITMSTQLLRFFLRFGYQVLIARLLLPKDFGLVAMAGPAISFIQLFTDLGLSQASIQHKDINQKQLSFLFWVSLSAGAIFAIVTAALARFYHEPRLSLVMMALGCMLLLTGFYSQHMAILYRRMNYRALGIIDITNFSVGALAGLAAAWDGAGYWSIVINQAVSTCVALVMAWLFTGWVPGMPGRFAEMRPLLHFGGNITGFNIVNFFSRNSDNILIGRFCGPQPLGLYDRAFKLMLLPFGQISAPFSDVALPLLAKSVEQPEFYRSAYRRMLEAVLLLLYPGIAFMIICSHDLVVLALGARWAAVAPIFALLGFDAFVSPVGNSMGWLFVSQGRTREMRDWGIVASLIFVAGFAIGLHWGPIGVAASYAISGLLEISFLWKVVTRRGPLRERDFLAVLVPFLVALPASFALLLLVHQHLPGTLWALALQGFGSYAVFAGGLCLTPGGRRLMADGVRRIQGLGNVFRRRPGLAVGE
jgi:PST family polysaccharide transporter